MYDFSKSAARTFEIEERALHATGSSLDGAAFSHACELLINTKGRVIVTGVGKSGHIANKIASTLTSTGTPAFFLHPAEAAHGDVGLVQPGDIAIILSKSGASDELLMLLPALDRIHVAIIAITCSTDSKLTQAAHDSGGALLLVHCMEEACPHDLAPTASTTASLALGDALAIALLEARQFSPQDFARLHPAGALGRKLTFSVRDLMGSGPQLPVVPASATLNEVMLEMSRKRYGATAVTVDGELAGIITDGDLRRHFLANPSVDSREVRATNLMSPSPRTIGAEALAIEALHQMEDTTPKVMQLLVLSESGELTGIIHMHDLVKAGISS
ncbi:MAG: KpsF/GutQ family sugar-phosphate isomerase [Bacteroidota bacterium]|nr:KpsF/GutQ family sugar-phosphate isomerase [Bacteroidota bacterium]MDP4234586.1 KpsF/GutQ family sugar-phosphate isomerase [Bacteroidota bacterium]MDP4243715.1 KpsF/GutQ family sugar-phosphate isomerase [Bacteroidota bacterium]MDP4288337.1 KpsF/GutQ family sugar-phosphate isomerase [Bacteroidota bacterium]